MGMTIEEFEEYAKTHNILFMTKDFYENRLKADMVAILEEIRLKANELEGPQGYSEFWTGLYAYDNIIQQKITSLKEEST